MMRLQQELGAVILRDPDVAAMGSQTGSTDIVQTRRMSAVSPSCSSRA